MKMRWVMILACQMMVCNSFATESVNKLNNESENAINLNFSIDPGSITKELKLSFPAAVNDAVLTITNISGHIVLSTTIEAGTTKANVNVSKLVSGSYFIVLNNNEFRSSKVFVKQ